MAPTATATSARGHTMCLSLRRPQLPIGWESRFEKCAGGHRARSVVLGPDSDPRVDEALIGMIVFSRDHFRSFRLPGPSLTTRPRWTLSPPGPNSKWAELIGPHPLTRPV